MTDEPVATLIASPETTAWAGSGTTVKDLRQMLNDLGLSAKGNKKDLRERLRKAKRRQVKEETQDKDEPETNASPSMTSELPSQPFDYYLFFDVEATCEKDGGFHYPNEIIEFPIVLVDGQTFDIVDEFRSYVRPTVRPQLSEFCTQLTGIEQEQVDNSPVFLDVLNAFQEFMGKWSLFQEKSATFVTDGPYDIRDFITKQCGHSHINPRPAYFTLPWINLRKLFRTFYHLKNNRNIPSMLATLGMTFQGRQHSGLDDARNLVAIAQRMHKEGCVFKTNIRWNERTKRSQR